MPASVTIFTRPMSPVRLDMGAAAEFLAHPGDGHQAHLLTVFFLEHGHGAAGQGLGHGHGAGLHRQVLHHRRVQVQLDVLQFLGGDGRQSG